MKKIVSMVACMAVAVMFSGAAIAADEAAAKTPCKGKKCGDKFVKADVNKDGKLSLDEFKTTCKAKDPEAVFKKMDTDNDGALTKEELKAGRKACKKCEKPAAPDAAAVPAPAPAPAPAK